MTAATANGAGTGASHSGPATVWVHGTFDGATVVIQGADADTDAKYGKLDKSIIRNDVFRSKGGSGINGTGTYYLRAVISGAGAATSLTVVTTQ